MKNMMKRLGFALIMLALLVSTLSVQAMAATGSINGLSIATSGSTGKISTGTNSVTLKVSKGWSINGGTAEDTFTFTHPSTSTSDVQVSFDYSFSGTAKTISGVTEVTETKCSTTLSPGGSFSVYVKATASGWSSAESTFKITNLSVVEVVDSAQVTVEYDVALGSVTADGGVVDTATALTVPSSGASFVATPSGDASFLAWVDGTGKIVSREKSYVCKPTEATLTLKAVFATTTPWFYVDNGDYLVEGWEEAVTHTGTVALANNATLPAGNYSVPSNVTMLIPYDSALTASVETPVVQTPTSSQATPTAYRTLSMESGAHITVNGTLTVPAAVRAGDTTTSLAATMVKGTYGHISMSSESSITVKSGAKLSTYGYITGSGSVIAESGAKVYEAFQVMRFRGGSATASMATNKKSFPISQYYVQNIEVPLTLYSGASEIAYVALYMSSTVIDSQVEYIGQSGCLFNLTSGYVVKQYDKTNDRQQIDFYGDLTVSKFAINIKYIISYSIDSTDFVMPITNNMTVDIHDGATVTIGANMSMLPGAEIEIHKGGKLQLSSGKSLYLYDLTEWSGKGFLYGGSDLAALPFAPNRTKTRTASDLKDAQIIVEGTLDASAGKLYTSSGGAAIKGAEGGQAKVTFASSTVDRQATQSGTDIKYHDVTMNSAYLQHGNGEYMTTATDTYTYSNGVWNCTNHSYNDGEVTTAETCTENGEKTYTCTACGETKKEVIPAKGHSYTSEETKAPTCTEKGETTYTCACGDTYTEEIAATGHTMTQVEAKAPTCTEKGWEAYEYCSVCDYTTYEEVAATGHSYTSEETKAPTCTEKGVKTYTCTCGDTYTEEIAAKGHTLTQVEAKAPTCTAAGHEAYEYCSVCDYTTYEEVAATGHSYEAVVTAPTCTEAGYTTYTCACGDSYVADEVAATGHSYTSAETKAPTCTEKGEMTYTCACGDTYTEEIAAKGHTLTQVEAQAPTCTAIGWDAYVTCSRCDYTTYVEKEALGHDEVAHEAQAPTCTAIGWDAYVTCSRCDYTTYVEKAALDHDEVAHEAQAPTCTAIGWDAYVTCSRCDYTTYVEKAALDHDEVAHEAQAPTCTEIGWDAYVTCSRCEYTTYVEKAKLGHDEVAHEAQAPTCTAIGWDAYVTCSRCDYTTYVEKEALDHNMTHHDAVDATCVATGNVEYWSCSECKLNYSDEAGNNKLENVVTEKDPNAHDLNTVIAQAATCTNVGWEEYKYCQREGCAYSTYAEIAMKEHSYTGEIKSDGNDKDATHSYKCVNGCNGYGNAVAHDWDNGSVTTNPDYEHEGQKTYTCLTEGCGATYTEAIPKLEGVEVNIDVRTNDLANGPQITLLSGTNAGENWDKEGTVIAGKTVDFSVTFDKGCVVIVAVTDAEGKVTYKKTPATATEDENTYNFSVQVVERLEIIVAVKGDLNGDGAITSTDAFQMQRTEVGLRELTEVQHYASDINNDNQVTSTDAFQVQRAEVGLRTFNWS